jgi:hypothetical protein
LKCVINIKLPPSGVKKDTSDRDVNDKSKFRAEKRKLSGKIDPLFRALQNQSETGLLHSNALY